MPYLNETESKPLSKIENVKISFSGIPFKVLLQGSWQSSTLRVINRFLHRNVNNAFNAINIKKQLGVNNWTVEAVRFGVTGQPKEISEPFTVEII